MSNSFTNQTLEQLVLWNNSEDYENKAFMLHKHLNVKVAALFLANLDADLTELKRYQAENIGLTVNWPFKPTYYKF